MACALHNDEQTQALLGQAKEDYGNGQYRKAIEAYEHLLECHTDIINDWFLKECLGLAYYYNEEYDKAESCLLAAIETIYKREGHKLNKLVIYDNLGCTYYRKYNYQRALEYFEKAKSYFDLYRGRTWGIARYSHHLIKGRCHYELKQFQEALDEFQNAYKEVLSQKTYSDVSDSENIITIEIGRTHHRLGYHAEARVLLESIDTATLETYWRAQLKYELFMVYLDLKEYEPALRKFAELESIGMEDIDRAGAYYVLGILYFRQGAHDKARENFNKSLNIPTKYEWIHNGCREYLKDIESAN